MNSKEKDYFTVQLTVTKDSTKLIQCTIFEGILFDSQREYYYRTIACKLFN